MQEITVELVETLSEKFLENKITEELKTVEMDFDFSISKFYKNPEFFNAEVISEFIQKNPTEVKTIKMDLLEEFAVALVVSPNSKIRLDNVDDIVKMEELLFSWELES